MLDKDNKKNEDIILPLVKKEGLENVNDTLNDTQNQINKIFIEQNKSERFQAIFSKYEKDISDYILNFFCRIFEKEEDLIKVLNKFNSKTINNKLKYLIELFNIQTLDDFDKMICNEITIK
ncbi:MAG: hypothetical protein LBU14_05210 [Candidatus Peribacteria bacterium]|jgi:hypothetical protein|nr:hypothetical protein [Candidatus Peribacteria bacterium]